MKYKHLFMGFTLGAGFSLLLVLVGYIPWEYAPTIVLQGATTAVAAFMLTELED